MSGANVRKFANGDPVEVVGGKFRGRIGDIHERVLWGWMVRFQVPYHLHTFGLDVRVIPGRHLRKLTRAEAMQLHRERRDKIWY